MKVLPFVERVTTSIPGNEHKTDASPALPVRGYSLFEAKGSQGARLKRSARLTCGQGGSDDLELFDFAANLFLALAKSLLQTAEQLIFLALGKRQVVVRKLRILLL